MLDDGCSYDANTAPIFLNDVAACMGDILELVYQRSRSVTAWLFFHIMYSASWKHVNLPPPFLIF